MKDDIQPDSTDNRQLPVPAGEAALAASAHSRINIPFNLGNWRNLEKDTVEQLAWFHQHALEEALSWSDVCAALGYSKSVVFRMLKGTYEGSWPKLLEAIASYRKICAERTAIKHAAFRETPTTNLITGGLSYALANNSMTVIMGESRMGKTATAKFWRDQNNHGRTAFIIAPAYGAARALMRELAACLGINRNTGLTNMHEAILRAFNPNRMLIVDEAHRLMPRDRRGEPVLLEILRDIHDRTDCGLALIATSRFGTDMEKLEYQYEQVLGRIGMPVRLPRATTWDDIEPIVSQYVERVPKALRDELLNIANNRGRLGILCETLKFASRIAAKDGSKLTPETIQKAIVIRRQMMGETIYAKK